MSNILVRWQAVRVAQARLFRLNEKWLRGTHRCDLYRDAVMAQIKEVGRLIDALSDGGGGHGRR